MERRSFLKKSGISGMALSLLPSGILPQEKEYAISELMGKTKIQLFGEKINLRKEAHTSFLAMKDAAKADGILIEIVSSYRSFDQQRAIFERKFQRFAEVDGLKPMEALDKIIEYSTIPGTSRHHWGTDMDITQGDKKTEGDVLVAEKFDTGGPFEGLKKWMDTHSTTYDFHLVYTDEPKRKGFRYEPWHYSYAPLAIPMLTAFRGKNILQLLEKEDFAGSEHFTSGFIKAYIRDNILDINPQLL